MLTDAFQSVSNEPMGCYISLVFDPPSEGFASYEIYNFIENTLRIEVEDLSVFRNSQSFPTGVIACQLTEEIPLSRLKRLHGKVFKGSPVDVRLYTTLTGFRKFILSKSAEKLSSIYLEPERPVPLIYVANFPDDDPKEDVETFFSKCGNILSIKKVATKNNSYYYIIEFSLEEGALKAARSLDNYELNGNKLRVAIMYKNAAERTFVIHHCTDIQWAKSTVNYYGNIEDIKSEDDDVYILMDTLDSSKAACLLLNKSIVNNIQVKTNFVDFEYFRRL